MLAPNANLYIYEIQGEVGAALSTAPRSFLGLWNEDEFSYLFFTAPEDDFVNSLVSFIGAPPVSRHEMKYCDWQTGMPPAGMSVGRLTFVPADHPCPPSKAILLDPSVVFGDGTHPTTLACLKCLDEIVLARAPKSMLDLGTGTGVLALAAGMLGVGRILAVDKNHLAILTTRRNVEVNSMTGRITVQEGEARLFIDEPFDLVAANLPFGVLRDIVPRRHTTLHKAWIVSGINTDQAKVLKDLFSEQGFTCEAEYLDPPWVTFVATRTKAAL